MKTCSSCKEDKQFKDFAKDKYTKDGYTYSCKECRNNRYNKWAKENPEAVKEKNNKSKERRKQYYKSEQGIKSSRRAHLKRKYGITLEEYNELLESQKGVCYICEEQESCQRNNFLCVDHCHKTNKIRGLLCNTCNRALGMFKDSIENLKRAIKYLKQNE